MAVGQEDWEKREVQELLAVRMAEVLAMAAVAMAKVVVVTARAEMETAAGVAGSEKAHLGVARVVGVEAGKGAVGRGVGLEATDRIARLGSPRSRATRRCCRQSCRSSPKSHR